MSNKSNLCFVSPSVIRLVASLVTQICLSCALIFNSAPLTAQQPNTTGPSADPVLERRIELILRSMMNIPARWQIQTAGRSESRFPGFDTMNITFIANDATHSQQTIPFLISKDSATLARLSEYSLNDIPETHVDTRGRPARGTGQSKVEIVVFGDYECPYCAKLHSDLFPATLIRYGAAMSVIYDDFPLTEIHPWAMHAAIDANCLAKLNTGLYWEYVDYIYAHQTQFAAGPKDVAKSMLTLDQIAEEEGNKGSIDLEKLKSCIAEQSEADVRSSMEKAKSLRIESTPAVLIDGERLSGYDSKEDLWAAIDRAMLARGYKVTPVSVSTLPPDQPEKATDSKRIP